ncbi:MAG TPA: amidohydrolase family protein, partial [Tepidisphaeraceae bacterium]
MLGAVIDDGCVVVDGDRITDVGPTHLLRPLRVDVEIDGVLMPGLINAHTHLELTNVPRPPRPGSFVDWVIETMASQRRDTPEAYARDRAHAVRQGVEQCLKFGVTCVGDISQNVVISRPILAGGPIRSVSFGECLGIGERAARFARLLESATTEMAFDESPWMRTGVSPHAPYTVDRGGYIDAYVASPRHDPLTTHFAETPHEAAFAGARAGPLAELYARLGFDPGEPTFPAHADVLFAFLGTFDRSRWLLAHVNYCT